MNSNSTIIKEQLIESEDQTNEFSLYVKSHNGGARRSKKSSRKAKKSRSKKAKRSSSKAGSSKAGSRKAKKASKAGSKKTSKRRRKHNGGGNPGFKAHLKLMAFLRENLDISKGKLMMVFSKLYKEKIAKSNPNLDSVALSEKAISEFNNLSESDKKSLVEASKKYIAKKAEEKQAKKAKKAAANGDNSL